jgi:hypothetical protein
MLEASVLRHDFWPGYTAKLRLPTMQIRHKRRRTTVLHDFGLVRVGLKEGNSSK